MTDRLTNQPTDGHESSPIVDQIHSVSIAHLDRTKISKPPVVLVINKGRVLHEGSPLHVGESEAKIICQREIFHQSILLLNFKYHIL